MVSIYMTKAWSKKKLLQIIMTEIGKNLSSLSNVTLTRSFSEKCREFFFKKKKKKAKKYMQSSKV